jgi:mannose-6-phosphate isomerase-like protein (cupin superfamily)
MKPVNLLAAFEQVTDYWSPKIAGELNGQYVKLAKLQGEFIWHSHPAEDELFLLVAGRLVMQFRDRAVTLIPGEFLIVPSGVEHCPLADPEAHVLLFEPKSTRNTGDVRDERTVEQPAWLEGLE